MNPLRNEPPLNFITTDMTYIVDGYNLLFSSTFKEWIRKTDFHSARSHLIAFVRSYLPARVIIVFDGREEFPQIEIEGVVFTRGESADEYIKRFVRNHPNPSQVTVVSNDRSIQGFARSMGARVMGVSEFLAKRKSGREQKRYPQSGFKVSPREMKEITEELKKEWGL